MTIGSKIFELRKKWNLSQEELADRLHVSRQTVSKWENDVVVPDVYNLKELAKAFQCTMDELIDDQQEVKTSQDGAIVEAMKYTGQLAKRHWQKGGYLLIFWGVVSLVGGMIAKAVMGNFAQEVETSFGFFDDFKMATFPGMGMMNTITSIPVILGIGLLIVGVCLILYDFKKTKNG
ncbi:MAG: helix-turn-helix domain-containing protein [Erysipelotrichaceae bacterium]|nr:helix-turn-helix domain-containing protein [Erysipelotrichaceae bacterium]